MAAFTKTEFVWFNGEIVPWESATVHASAHALQYGTGVFEGMRSYDTPDGAAIFRLDAHMRRLHASAAAYEIAIPYSVEQLSNAALEVVRVNGLENAYLRPLAFFDSYSFSVWPKDCPVTTVIMGVPGKPYFTGDADHAVRVTMSSVRRIDETTLPPHVKACGHYMNSVRAVQEAMRRGYDDAILLNSKGDVAEGSGANLFVVRGGTVVTNDASASIVLGITRDSVLTIARDLGLPIEVRAIALDDLASADELFFCGTAVEVTPIKQLDARTIGDGKPGPVTRRIQGVFNDTVHGKLPQYRQWLAYAAPEMATASPNS
jgi:branched-chain amino acid aminotransferase